MRQIAHEELVVLDRTRRQQMSEIQRAREELDQQRTAHAQHIGNTRLELANQAMATDLALQARVRELEQQLQQSQQLHQMAVNRLHSEERRLMKRAQEMEALQNQSAVGAVSSFSHEDSASIVAKTPPRYKQAKTAATEQQALALTDTAHQPELPKSPAPAKSPAPKAETSESEPKASASSSSNARPSSEPKAKASSARGAETREEETRDKSRTQPITKRTRFQGYEGALPKMRAPGTIDAMTGEQLIATAKAYNEFITRY